MVTANNYMFRPLTGHNPVVHSLDAQPDDGPLEAETCSCYLLPSSAIYEGGPKYNRNLNVACELEDVARCAARCRESTQYSSILPRCVNPG